MVDRIVLLSEATSNGDGSDKVYTLDGETQLVCVGTFDGASVTASWDDIETGETIDLCDADGVAITFTAAGVVGGIVGHYGTTMRGNVASAGGSTSVTLYLQETTKYAG